VGDVGDTLIKGKTLRSAVLAEVQRFTRQRCNADCPNRIIVTSRLEGYRRGDLQDFDEMELSALALPEEVREFLLRWFAAHEQKNHPKYSVDEVYRKAQASVDPLMSDILRSASVQRLAINPLLLTILAMIHKLGTRLPNERVRLYQIVTNTMVESWRQANTRHDITIYEVLPVSRVTPMMAALAYWVHENHPGGSMPANEWQAEIKRLLVEKDDELKDEKANELAEMFMRHAREEVGLLIERSPGQIGFFHLTLEEYLAGVEIATRRESERRALIKKHWANPRWRESLLLAAGQLMLNGSQELDEFVLALRMCDDQGQTEQLGLPALLAGKAIVDVGRDYFNRKVVRETRRELIELATTAHMLPATRAECADLADELGYVPDDLYSFVEIPGDRAQASDRPSATDPRLFFAKYLVTNDQYARFLQTENFADRELWSGFSKFSEPDEQGKVQQIGDLGEAGWDWLQDALKDKTYLVENGVLYPRYWRDARFGLLRPHAPVVGISWYEANAYCQWLSAQKDLSEWQVLASVLGQAASLAFRLPTETEWVLAAGGEAKNRYAFGELKDVKDLPRYANTNESGINRTTPVWMYPGGATSEGLMDMSGNVFEWQANNRGTSSRALRGGSWSNDGDFARVSGRFSYDPDGRLSSIGFRLVVFALPN
jgi:formylglycine-generating enzyme required for sulfatase activity